MKTSPKTDPRKELYFIPPAAELELNAEDQESPEELALYTTDDPVDDAYARNTTGFD